MSDYIRIEDAKDALQEKVFHNLTDEFYGAMQVLDELQPADVAPVVHGKWIDYDGNKVQLNEHGETCGTCFCNQCGEWLVASDEYAVKGYFCPNCGAKMDGGDEHG